MMRYLRDAHCKVYVESNAMNALNLEAIYAHFNLSHLFLLLYVYLLRFEEWILSAHTLTI